MPKTARLNVRARPAETHETGRHSVDKQDYTTAIKECFQCTDCMWSFIINLPLVDILSVCLSIYIAYESALHSQVHICLRVLFMFVCSVSVSARSACVRIKCALKSDANCYGANMCEHGLFSTTLFWLNQVVFLHFYLLLANQIPRLMGTYERHTAADPWAAQTSRKELNQI